MACRAPVGCAAALWLLASPAVAQTSRPAAIAIDTSALVSEARDEDGGRTSGVILDAFVSASLGRGFEVMARPYVQQLPSGEWNRQIWLAAARYEHRGPIGVRVEAGLIPPPVGLANLTIRPHLIPTINQPSTLFQTLPALAAGGPRLTLLGTVYPYGVSATVSKPRWDVRAAVIDTSPMRTRRVFGDENPPRFRNVVVGGGVTPVIGLRLGLSVTRGGWLEAGELPSIEERQDATLVTIESELSYRHTKLSAEWVRDSLELGDGSRHATGWFVQAQQAVGPRWVVAGRVERISGRGLAAGTIPDPSFTGSEATLGYRVSPELTVRASHRARRVFGQDAFMHEATVALVWWRRWM